MSDIKVRIASQPTVMVNQSGLGNKKLVDLFDVELGDAVDGGILIYDESTSTFVLSTRLDQQEIDGSSSTITIKSVLEDDDVSLALNELAYDAINGILQIGSNEEPEIIGGKFFTDKLLHNPGTNTPGSAIIVDDEGSINTLRIGNVLQLGPNSIVADGDLTVSVGGVLDFNGSILSEIADPIDGGDAVNLRYLEQLDTTPNFEFSSVPDAIPEISELDFGALAINTHDGVLYFKYENEGFQRLVSIGDSTANINVSLNSSEENQVVDSFPVTAYSAAKYLVSIRSGTDFHSAELLIAHNGILARSTVYGEVFNDVSMGTLSADVSDGMVRVIFSPAVARVAIRMQRTHTPMADWRWDDDAEL